MGNNKNGNGPRNLKTHAQRAAEAAGRTGRAVDKAQAALDKAQAAVQAAQEALAEARKRHEYALADPDLPADVAVVDKGTGAETAAKIAVS